MFVSYSFIACSDDDNEQVITVQDLPANVQSFLSTHFDGQNARLVEKDDDGYDVYLENGMKIEFDLSGEWDNIEGNGQALSDDIIALIPDKITTYITTNYPDQKIQEVDKERYGYEVKLLNRLELMFDANGEFIGMDADNDDHIITINDLPAKAQEFLNTYFQGQTAKVVTRDNDSYDVYLNNGFDIDFTLSGDWDSVDGKNQAVPQNVLALVPQSITDYISSNYQGQQIYEVNKESYGYEIELSNRLELKFDANGSFLGIDD